MQMEGNRGFFPDFEKILLAYIRNYDYDIGYIGEPCEKMAIRMNIQ